MNCPVCNFKNSLGEEFCIQCKSALTVYKLIDTLKGEVLMTNEELVKLKQDPHKLIKIIIMFQGFLILFLLLLNIGLVFKYLKFFKTHKSSSIDSLKIDLNSYDKQILGIIATQLDLIKEQRKENKELQEKLMEKAAGYDSSAN